MADAPEEVNDNHHATLEGMPEYFDVVDVREWVGAAVPMILACGCVVDVNFGDKVTYAYDSEDDVIVPVGIEHPTIH